MKKYLLIVCFSVVCFMAFGQTNVVVNGEKTIEKVEDKSYYINGISSKEDIGGITTEALYMYINKFRGRGLSLDSYYGVLVITNHNAVPVTVNWETHETYDGRRQSQTGIITLKPNERMEVCHTRYEGYKIQDVKTITRKLASGVDVVAELKKYKELLDAGIISQEEFDTKKKELLGF